MRKLVFRAGKEAYDQIKSGQFTLENISAVVAAAGGPKWFTTYGLVRYIIGDLLRDSAKHLHFLGSSVGAWQMAAALTSDPVKAIDRLQAAYANSMYSEQPTPEEISSVCSDIIKAVIDGQEERIINCKSRSLHVITSRGRGILSSNSNVSLGAGFALGFSLNAMNRKWLRRAVERVLFSSSDQLPYDVRSDYLPTKQVPITVQNLLPALRASGAIPFMMEGISNIKGAPNGKYWDGGMTDYHITFPYNTDGIVLHPHFLPDVTKGWFDKKLPRSRKASTKFMSKVLLVTPSPEFVASLPRHQISDMKDFKYFGLDQQARIKYWNEISQRSLELGEEMREVFNSGQLIQEIQLY